MTDQRPDRLMSADGKVGWFAYSPDGTRTSGENEPASKTFPEGGAVEDADELVAVELTEMERRMLFIGLFDWGGPAYCGDPLAQALGFRDVQNLYDEGYPLAEAIGRGEPQSRRDWTRALASLEVMLGTVLGSGEWGAVHGYDDEELFVALKALRSKLPTSRSYLRQ